MSKTRTEEQLPFHLPLEAAQAREDLVVTTANSAAVALIDSWPDWPGAITILAGPVGAGKTHIANVWAAKAGAVLLYPTEHQTNQVRPSIPETGNFVVENPIEDGFEEAWLFHLINAVRASGGYLLMTSRKWPADWGVLLPDLKSRLGAAQLLELHEPDDALLTGVLAKLFSDRQLNVERSVVDYLVVRMERSLASAQRLVEAIDRLSLVQQRPVTRKLVADALAELDQPLD